MASDLELIKQLEEEIGIELTQLSFDEVSEIGHKGFTISENGIVSGLSLYEVGLGKIPLIITQFKHLKHLSLHKNKISDISMLNDLGNLTRLDLSYNQISDISILKGLWNLKELYLSSNQISDISILKDLGNLTLLHLRNNQISDISMLKELKNLNFLDLRNNQISEFPEELLRLQIEIKWEWEWDWLAGIFLENNPLEYPPIEIVKRGKEAIKNYFQSLAGKKQALNEVKVLLVGDGGAGKTSLFKRLMKKRFDSKEPQTHGINVNHWIVKKGKERLKTNIWDFGGQEIMHATHQFFLSKRSLYILVLDGRRDEKTEYWLKHIQSFGGDSPVLVVLNKIDENPGYDVNRPFLKEKYKNIKGFYWVSCATGEGIKTFSQHLIDELTQVDMIKTMWAKNWFTVKTQLEKMIEPFISYDQFKKICEAEKIISTKRQDTLVDFLNDLGVILHFKDFELEDTHVLEPKWVTEAVYKIINSEKLSQSKGVLNLKMLEYILQKKTGTDYDYPRHLYRYIISLMKKFELCYGIDEETVLIPDLLEVGEPSFDFDYNSSLKFIILYDFLPRSIMSRFIVNMHKDVKSDLQWRTGVILKDKDFESTAVIKADNEAKRIYIYVNGVQKRDYFAAILATLRRINRSFEKLKTTELIPIPDEPDITVSYKHLIRLEKESIEFYFPGESEKKYRVKDLLGSIGGEIPEDETLQMLKQIQIAQMQRKSGKKK